MAPLTTTAGTDGVTVTGFRDLPGWGVTVHPSGSVTVTPPAGASIDATAWRTIPIGSVLRVASAVRAGDVLDALLSMFASDGTDPSRSSREWPKRDHLTRVAQVYRLALEHGVKPEEALMRHFDVAHPKTTHRWITQARQQQPPLLGSYAEEVARAKSYEPHRPDGSRRSPGRGSTATKTAASATARTATKSTSTDVTKSTKGKS